jgi:hypothetical protein
MRAEGTKQYKQNSYTLIYIKAVERQSGLSQSFKKIRYLNYIYDITTQICGQATWGKL